MKPDLENELLRRWPALFRAPARLEIDGIDLFDSHLGDGWFPLIDGLCEALTHHAEKLGRAPPEIAWMAQAFDVLAYFVRSPTEFDLGAITLACALSRRYRPLTGALAPECGLEEIRLPLARDIAVRHGIERADGEPDQLSSNPADKMTVILKARYSAVLIGNVQLPPGWFALAEALLECIAFAAIPRSTSEIRGWDVRAKNGQLVVEFEGSGDRVRGFVACATAMATRIDPETGSLRQRDPVSPGQEKRRET